MMLFVVQFLPKRASQTLSRGQTISCCLSSNYDENYEANKKVYTYHFNCHTCHNVFLDIVKGGYLFAPFLSIQLEF